MKSSSRWARGFVRIVRVLALAYPLALLGVVLALRFIGEDWWATTVGLYLPALGYALPLLPIAILIALSKERWLFWTLPVAVLLLLFPLLGLSLSTGGGAGDGRPRLRVLSFNVNSGHGGQELIAQEIERHAPDWVLLQESDFGREKLLELLKEKYPFVVVSTQFVTASRHPIVETTEPERLPYGDKLRSPRFLRHVIESPLGRVAVYNVHPLSPRESLAAVRGQGLREEIRSGRLLSGANRQVVEDNVGLRRLQVEAIGRAVRAETLPTIVAGDTNLPQGSALLARNWGQLQDGFVEAGSGFGYTFPTRLPFLRIDRILASSELEFVSFEVDCGAASDHRCVVAELEKAD